MVLDLNGWLTAQGSRLGVFDRTIRHSDMQSKRHLRADMRSMAVHIRRFLSIALLMSCLQQLPAQNVKAEYNKDENFTRFKTYSWTAKRRL